jgi:selenocysteine lyase/cysteine desulfurase
MQSRRSFLGTISAPTAAAGVLTAVPLRWDSAIAAARELSETPGTPQEVASQEEFWGEIQQAFTTDRSLVNLNNGGVSPTPAHVLEAMKRDLDFANQLPVYNGWQILEPQREGVRARLAREWGVDAEEVAITRNASESLQILQFGHDLQAGDEVLTTTQDYGRMVTTFNQRERREGIVMKQIQIPIPAEDDAEVVRLFEEAITDRTRLILMCHMINITGQILPVRHVVAMARRHDIPVIIDGAHALAHFDFKISDLDCDNYSTSLHKWLFAPIGNGLLYVRRDKIPGIWPLMAAAESRNDDIRKYEEVGTHPEANFLAVGEALTFHQMIGAARKEARLVYLRNYWAEQLLQHENVRLNTSLKPGFAAGIANVQITDVETGPLRNWLWREHRIYTVAINHAEFNGLRISPSVYTTIEELDRFVDAMTDAAKNGIPA